MSARIASTSQGLRGSSSKFAGFSLVEMMVAMAVGLVLLAGLIQVWSSSRTTYRLAEAQSRVQETGRFAAQMLATDLRATRSLGCRSLALDEAMDSLNVIACDLLDPTADCSGEPVIGTQQPMGYDASQRSGSTWLAGLPGTSASGIQQSVADRWFRGDVLVSWGAVGDGVYVLSLGGLDDDQRGTIDFAELPSDLDVETLALISDCEATDVFEITSATAAVSDLNDSGNNQPGKIRFDGDANRTDRLSRSYNRVGSYVSPGTTIRARLYPFEYNVYYICCMDTDDGQIEVGGDVDNCRVGDARRYRPALCRWSSANNRPNSRVAPTRQMISDVADMRLTYSGTHGSTLFYNLDADDVPDWGAVNRIRVQLLATHGEQVLRELASPNRGRSDDLGAGMADDRRFYQAFEVTIAIRSNSPWFVQ